MEPELRAELAKLGFTDVHLTAKPFVTTGRFGKGERVQGKQYAEGLAMRRFIEVSLSQ